MKCSWRTAHEIAETYGDGVAGVHGVGDAYASLGGVAIDGDGVVAGGRFREGNLHHDRSTAVNFVHNLTELQNRNLRSRMAYVREHPGEVLRLIAWQRGVALAVAFAGAVAEDEVDNTALVRSIEIVIASADGCGYGCPTPLIADLLLNRKVQWVHGVQGLVKVMAKAKPAVWELPVTEPIVVTPDGTGSPSL